MALAKQVSKIRKIQGKLLADQILEALKELNFLDVRFEIRLKTLKKAMPAALTRLNL